MGGRNLPLFRREDERVDLAIGCVRAGITLFSLTSNSHEEQQRKRESYLASGDSIGDSRTRSFRCVSRSSVIRHCTLERRESSGGARNIFTGAIYDVDGNVARTTVISSIGRAERRGFTKRQRARVQFLPARRSSTRCLTAFPTTRRDKAATCGLIPPPRDEPRDFPIHSRESPD